MGSTAFSQPRRHHATSTINRPQCSRPWWVSYDLLRTIPISHSVLSQCFTQWRMGFPLPAEWNRTRLVCIQKKRPNPITVTNQTPDHH
eukprot:1896234-Prorocentrum_lima.AAC.1